VKITGLNNLADFSINTDCHVPVGKPIFEPIPSLIQFADYEPLQIKEKIFRLRNKDRVSRRVRIIQPDSRLFQVFPFEKRGAFEAEGTKVAAGMETKFIIRFSPEAKIDYMYELIVVTEREEFVVPILAVGKRAMIDFPDSLDFGNCLVKYCTEKPVIIRNLGEKTTKWTLDLPPGFYIDQKEGVLERGKYQQIIIKFFPT
jgi:hydrocephalus-inducing protein